MGYMHVYPGVKQQDNTGGTSVLGRFESEMPGGVAVVSAEVAVCGQTLTARLNREMEG